MARRSSSTTPSRGGRTGAVAAAVLGLLAVGAGTGVAAAGSGPVWSVGPPGVARFTSVQAAVDAVPPGNTRPVTITVAPGRYRELVTVPADKPYITLRGATGAARDVVITYDNSAGTRKPDGTTYGTSGSASVLIEANDFRAEHVTFENAFDEQAHAGESGHQAVALRLTGDRAVFVNTRFLGNQDTLYLNSPSTGQISRAYLRDCYVEGDVDFIFGRGTAVFDGGEIRSLDRGSTSNNGYVTAASTALANPYGFLFHRSRFTSDAPAGTVHLGRPWHAGGDPNAVGQVVVRESALAAHIRSSPWTDMSGWPWRDARFFEYRNTGPGATPASDRPQLSDAQAPDYTVRRYLAGSDGWAPVTR
ncbi:pectinesterase family protein [Goodfellowiella coeruleoviolacea]|uniref:Pectinesterase n=1 Tax=Goodfellowiella coeruleoviolacea TaxID=334858 RepID=A0AAE3KHH2_9PSEU|nr:pectinesterase family protein [Goodfellowiella coeruleoviolacea]MCP2166444.1 pectinesterase [Goodfellowiella coeruleoviolacea]